MNRIKEAKRVFKHKVAIYNLWKKEITKVSLMRVIKHDFEKLLFIILFGDKIATKIHRKIARHHNIKTDDDLFEAYLDWASARYTKPEMQMDALDTCKKYHPELFNTCLKHYKIVKYK